MIRNYAVQTGSVLNPTLFGLALIKSYQALSIEIYKPNLRAAMEKDLTRICKGELSTEGLFDKMRTESKKFFETVQNKTDLLQNNLENYLANGIKNDEYAKLNEIAEGNLNETENPKSNNGAAKQNDNDIYSKKVNSNYDYFVNEKIDFSKELEQNEKSKAEAEEIIKSILADKHKNKPNSEKSKLKLENSLRGMLKMGRKKMESDDSSETDESNNNDNKSKEQENKKDFLKLENECPSCKTSKLKLLKNKNTFTYFIGCSGFPKCSFIKSINNPTKVRISNDFCPTCKENNKKTLLFELEFNNLKRNNGDNIKEECFVCLLENDPKIKNATGNNKYENQRESYKKPYYPKNGNYNYKNSFYNKKFKKNQPDEE